MQVEPQRWKVEAAEQRNRENFLRARVAALAADSRRVPVPKTASLAPNTPTAATLLTPGADKSNTIPR
jgi:hypothetical protein